VQNNLNAGQKWIRTSEVNRPERIAEHSSQSGSEFNTLRTGSFKLFKRSLPEFLTILTLQKLNYIPSAICWHLLAHHFLHVSRISVKSLTLRLLMSYIYVWSAYS